MKHKYVCGNENKKWFIITLFLWRLIIEVIWSIYNRSLWICIKLKYQIFFLENSNFKFFVAKSQLFIVFFIFNPFDFYWFIPFPPQPLYTFAFWPLSKKEVWIRTKLEYSKSISHLLLHYFEYIIYNFDVFIKANTNPLSHHPYNIRKEIVDIW